MLSMHHKGMSSVKYDHNQHIFHVVPTKAGPVDSVSRVGLLSPYHLFFHYECNTLLCHGRNCVATEQLRLHTDVSTVNLC